VLEPLQICARKFPRWRRLPSNCKAARSRCHEAGFEILHADANISAQAVLGDGARERLQQIVRGDLDIIALFGNLIGPGAWCLSKALSAMGNEAGMRDPGAVVAVAGLSRFLVGRGPSASAASLAAGSLLMESLRGPCRPSRERRDYADLDDIQPNRRGMKTARSWSLAGGRDSVKPTRLRNFLMKLENVIQPAPFRPAECSRIR